MLPKMILHVGNLKIYSIYQANKMTKIFNYILISISTLKVENNYPFWQMLGADFYLFQV